MTNFSRPFSLLLLILLTAVAAGATTYGVKDIPNVQVADSTRLVSNPDHILSPQAEAAIDSRLLDIRRTSTAEVAMVVVDDISYDDIDLFANDLFEEWGLGKKNNNGLLVLVVKDRRKAVIRTGYGLEGVIPDITAGHILREQMFPRFAEGDFDTGALDAADEIHHILTDQVYAEEIRADADASSDEMSLTEFLLGWLALGGLIALALVGWLIFIERRNKGKDGSVVYDRLQAGRPLFLAMSFLGAGIPFLAYWMLRNKMKSIRNHPRNCPNCGARMQKLDEETDNLYLTPSQDAEERINSVDYDVWLCPTCNDTLVIPFENKDLNLSYCPHCQARACRLTGTRTLVRPTTRSRGRGAKIYSCLNCGKRTEVAYSIPKLASPVVVGGFGGGHGGGGGFGGGGFGGGHTGGGGASGGW